MSTASPSSYTTLKLDAISYVETANDVGVALDGSEAFSIDAWVRFNGLPSTGSLLSQPEGFLFGIEADRLVLHIPGFGDVFSDPTKQAIDDVEWQYVAVCFDGASARFYINGQFNSMQSMSGTPQGSTVPFQMGVGLQVFVDSVRVYNAAISTDQVLNNMFDSPAAGSVVADFDFTVVPAADQGPGKLPVQLVAGAAQVVYTPAAHLDSRAFIQPLNDDDVNPGGDQVDAYTVQSWVFVESSLTPEQSVFVNSDLESDSGIALLLRLNADGTAFNVVSQRGSNDDAHTLTSTGLVQLNRWTNVATTFDGTTLSIYIDGVLDCSAPFPPISLVRDSSDLIIGAAWTETESFGVETLQGFVARVDVWSRALLSSELVQYTGQVPALDADGIRAIYDFSVSPPTNQVSNRPVSLASGAYLGGQLAPAAGSATSRRSTSPHTDESEADRALIATLGGEGHADEFVRANPDIFRDAMERSLAECRDESQRAAHREIWERVIGTDTTPGKMPFSTTMHHHNGERIMLCHTRRGSYIAWRSPSSETDDCLAWRIQLLFVVVGGAIDALFAIRCYLNPRAVSYITRLLNSPNLRAKLAAGSALSVGMLFSICVSLQDMGAFLDLLKLMASIGFWTLLRIAARLVLTFFGVGAADIIASLIATVALFIYTYSQRPASCDPLPTVTLAAIQFSHSATSITGSAFPVRKGFTTPISPPEWVPGRGAADSPAAYSIGDIGSNPVTIKAKFTISTQSATSMQIKAVGGGILGAIDPVTVNFANGVSTPEYVTLTLSHQALAAAGVHREDAVWQWSALLNSTWTTIASSAHRVYTVLSRPALPWNPSRSGDISQQPWTSLLDFVCTWAEGSKTPTDAATAITTKVNGGVGLRYDTAQGESKYTKPGSVSQFYGTQFVSLLNGGVGNGNVVNCTDCATIVVTCANLVGCNLSASTMRGNDGNGFDCNEIIAIGASSWAYPFPPRNRFAYHEVAWTGALGLLVQRRRDGINHSGRRLVHHGPQRRREDHPCATS